MTWSNAFSTSWHVFCREREVQEILLHSFYTASLYYSRDRRENTRPCANCLKIFQPCRASSLFAVDCFSFLSRPRVFFPANGFSRQTACVAEWDFFFFVVVVLVREKGKTEKVTTQILDLSYRISLVEISSARVSSSSLRKLRVEFFLFLSNFSDP